MGHTLESYRFFPYIAWAVVIGFACFVWFLSTTFAEELSELEASGIYVEQAIDRDLRSGPITY